MKAMAQLKKDRPELFETKKEAAQHSPKKPPAISAYLLFTKEWNKKVRSKYFKALLSEYWLSKKVGQPGRKTALQWSCQGLRCRLARITRIKEGGTYYIKPQKLFGNN